MIKLAAKLIPFVVALAMGFMSGALVVLQAESNELRLRRASQGLGPPYPQEHRLSCEHGAWFPTQSDAATTATASIACTDAIHTFEQGNVSLSIIADAVTACTACTGDSASLRYCSFLAWKAATHLTETRSDLRIDMSLQRDSKRDMRRHHQVWVAGPPAQLRDQLEYGMNPVERANYYVLEEALALCNTTTSDAKELPVVNIGANEGFYLFAAGAEGCRTIAFEPQFGCVMGLLLANAFNTFRHASEIFVRAVAPFPIKFETPCTCDGGAQFFEGNVRTIHEDAIGDNGDHKPVVPVGSVRLDDVLHQDVAALIVDVEGAEANVLHSGLEFFRRHKVHNLIIEWNPSRWHRFHVTIGQGVDAGILSAAACDWECRRTNVAGFSRCADALGELFREDSIYDIHCRIMKETTWLATCGELKPKQV